ncbi:MAG TPA: hypothetical protein VL990_11500 [Acidobacteriaceae bacterium]|nr:hypothetical protein [Acidobacteriaceae bacterium]
MAPSTANPPSLPRGTRAWGLACAFLLNGALWLGAILAVRAVLQLVH